MIEKEIILDQIQKLNIVEACKQNLQTVFNNMKIIHEQMARVKEDARLLNLDNYYVYKSFDHMSHSINHLEDAIAYFGAKDDMTDKTLNEFGLEK